MNIFHPDILIFKDNFSEDSDTFLQLGTSFNIPSNYHQGPAFAANHEELFPLPRHCRIGDIQVWLQRF